MNYPQSKEAKTNLGVYVNTGLSKTTGVFPVYGYESTSHPYRTMAPDG